MKNYDLYIAAAILAGGLALSGVGHAMDLPEGTYAGVSAGAQTWPCTSNDCELEASNGFLPQGEAYVGCRVQANDWLTIGGEIAAGARMMESHGRNYEPGDDNIPNRFGGSGRVDESFDHYGLAATVTGRFVAEIEIVDGLHVGPLAGGGGGAFFLSDDTAVAPVYEVGMGARYEINNRWSLTARYTYMDTLGGSLAGRDLSYSSHGGFIGMQFNF